MLKALLSLARRHLEALRVVVTAILPIIIRDQARPVVFSRYSGIGDIICTFPAALELKKRHPGATFIYNCHPESACLVRMAGVATSFTSTLQIGLIGYWYRFLLSGYYHFGYQDEFTDAASSESMIHEFARQHGVEVSGEHPHLENEPGALARVQERLENLRLPTGPLIVIHPGPSWPVREWPHESWIRLVDALRARGVTNIIRLGVGKHLTFGDVQIDELPNIISMVDQLTLEETVALISQGDLFVGIDSGLLHIAPCVQTSAVGVWGPTLPHLRFSESNARSFVSTNLECRGCHHRTPRLHWITSCPYEIACMKTISVEDVLDACLSRLNPANAGINR